MTTLLQVVAVAAIVFGVVIAITGRAKGLDDVAADRADNSLPPERPVNADDVEAVKFSLALRGYRMDEVDEALDRISAELRRRDEVITELQAQLGGSGSTDVTPDDEGRWGKPRPAGARPAGARPALADAVSEDTVYEDTVYEDAVSDDALLEDTVSPAQASLGVEAEWVEHEEDLHDVHVDDVAERVAEHQIGVAPWQQPATEQHVPGEATGPEEISGEAEPAVMADGTSTDESDADATGETSTGTETYADDVAEVDDAPDDAPNGEPDSAPDDAEVADAEPAAPSTAWWAAPPAGSALADPSPGDQDDVAADGDDDGDGDGDGDGDEPPANPYRPELPPFFRQ